MTQGVLGADVVKRGLFGGVLYGHAGSDEGSRGHAIARAILARHHLRLATREKDRVAWRRCRDWWLKRARDARGV